MALGIQETRSQYMKLSSLYYMRRILLCVMGITFVIGSAFGQSKPKQTELKYQELLDSGEISRVVGEISSAYVTENAEKEVEELGFILGSSAKDARAILEILPKDSDTINDTLRAELLLWIARGDGMPDWQRKERKTQPILISTDEVGHRAAELLDHYDPFVRGLAEWAIAVRVGMENAG